MKKIFLIGGGILITILFIFTIINLSTKKSDTNLTKITVAEVTHSVFYAPWYVALEKGFFEDEGLEIEVILTPGADKVTAAVLSDDVQIGFCGPEGTIYVYNGGEDDYLQTFAGLTKRDGQFIVSRKNIDNFKVEDLIGKEILVGRKGGMPSLNFINGINNSNIDINDMDLNYSIEFAALSGAFIGGTGDFVNLFDDCDTKITFL